MDFVSKVKKEKSAQSERNHLLDSKGGTIIREDALRQLTHSPGSTSPYKKSHRKREERGTEGEGGGGE